MRHRRMLSPINSNKHYVHRTNIAVASGALQSEDVTRAVVAPATTNSFNVEEGSVVKAVHLEYWILGDELAGNTSQFTLIVEKEPGNGTAMTAVNAANLGAYPNKKNILYVTQGLINPFLNGGGPIPLIRNWVLIPKGKQRQGLDDSIRVHLLATGKLRFCGVATYKEFR